MYLQVNRKLLDWSEREMQGCIGRYADAMVGQGCTDFSCMPKMK